MSVSFQTPQHRSANAFALAEAELFKHWWRSEVSVEPIPSPQRIAPHSAAITADVTVDDQEVGSGRLILLHDPAGNEAWQGTFRCVTFARADVDLEMVTDPLLADVAWSWLLEALETRGASHIAPSGTVTAVSSRAFGGMSEEPDRAEVEIRASWTALLDDGESFAHHLAAWQDLLCQTAGLPPLPEGVVMLGSRTVRGR